jgi:hypothetical protein
MSLIPTGGRLASRLSDPVGQRETQAASQHIRFKGHVRRRVQLVGDRAGEDLGPKTCGAALRKAGGTAFLPDDCQLRRSCGGLDLPGDVNSAALYA